ncbi:MAG: polysaccharide biosynthesis/export family protein [Odoribacter sp.]|nr:polysaccharide biosynthesis/export family protein [Odoribacter sp.]
MKFITTTLAIAGMTLLAGCSVSKKVPYIVDAEAIPAEILSEQSHINDPILAPGDLLNIEVTATDMQSVVPFNKGMYINDQGNISRVSSSTSTNTNNLDVSTDYYLINQDGTIYFPIIGTIDASGKTKLELAQEITNAIYPQYIKEKPKVEVRLMNFRVVVTGAVKAPGIYQSHNERMNFFEAIALAGDLDIKGDRENILLYRTNSDGTREVHKINIHDKNFLLSPYFSLQQNDIIYVAPNSSMAANAWQLNPAVAATITYVGGISSLASLVIGIVNLTKN